jgi:hypothetical protein
LLKSALGVDFLFVPSTLSSKPQAIGAPDTIVLNLWVNNSSKWLLCYIGQTIDLSSLGS